MAVGKLKLADKLANLFACQKNYTAGPREVPVIIHSAVYIRCKKFPPLLIYLSAAAILNCGHFCLHNKLAISGMWIEFRVVKWNFLSSPLVAKLAKILDESLRTINQSWQFSTFKLYLFWLKIFVRQVDKSDSNISMSLFLKLICINWNTSTIWEVLFLVLYNYTILTYT